MTGVLIMDPLSLLQRERSGALDLGLVSPSAQASSGPKISPTTEVTVSPLSAAASQPATLSAAGFAWATGAASGVVSPASPAPAAQTQRESNLGSTSSDESVRKTKAAELENFMAEQLQGLSTPKPTSRSKEIRNDCDRSSLASLAKNPPAASTRASGTTTNQTASEERRVLLVKIISRRDRDSVTWYTLRAFDGACEILYIKRYNDFKAFDVFMRRSSVLSKIVPQLPAAGVLGLRHKLNVGDFNDRRQAGLQQWLDSVVKNVKGALVREFLAGSSAQGHGYSVVKQAPIVHALPYVASVSQQGLRATRVYSDLNCALCQ